MPARTFDRVIDLAKQKPRSLNYGTAGAGTAHQLIVEIFKLKTETDVVHMVRAPVLERRAESGRQGVLALPGLGWTQRAHPAPEPRSRYLPPQPAALLRPLLPHAGSPISSRGSSAGLGTPHHPAPLRCAQDRMASIAWAIRIATLTAMMMTSSQVITSSPSMPWSERPQ
ncbi:hypothetical protein [Bradyrhizobium sp. JR4.1]|uniref:hypothetical protein n=1 Tax=Bradyrhizobium sp. JR4.1 TaxID=3156372 RepID=UPI00339B8548